MTLEIQFSTSAYQWRQNPINPCMVDVRENRHNARWEWVATWYTPEEARQALLNFKANVEKKEAQTSET